MIDASQYFLRAYPSDAPRTPLDGAEWSAFAKTLPASIAALYEEVGLGKHRQGMFELIDPGAYAKTYAAFFGGDAVGRTPFLVNAFGEPIAVKRLRGPEDEVSILHTYGPKLSVLAVRVVDFFEDVLGTDDGLQQVLNVRLFDELRQRLPRLRAGQCYGFDPAVLAEAERKQATAADFTVVDTLPHLALLLRRAGEE